MSQYRLTKKYPGSPKIGYITNFDDEGEDWSAPEMLLASECKDYPELWEKVKEKDYEILSFRTPQNTQMYVGRGITGTWCIFSEVAHQNFDRDDEWMIKNGYIIESIKRLSDGESFTIGDEVINKAGQSFTITGFTLDSTKEHLLALGGNGGINITKIEHYKQPLFTTEDGVDVYEDSKVWWLRVDVPPAYYKDSQYDICLYNDTWEVRSKEECYKWFSSKEKAEEYRNNLLIEEAENRYPKGTKYKTLRGNINVSSGSFRIMYAFKKEIVQDAHDFTCVYKVETNKWAEIVKDKNLEDYENKLLEMLDCMEISNVYIFNSDFYKHLKVREPKLYWTKVLQLIANDLNEGWDWRKFNSVWETVFGIAYLKILTKYSVVSYDVYNSGNIMFKTINLAEKAIDIMGDKLDYIYK